jgi:hypothetical protein
MSRRRLPRAGHEVLLKVAETRARAMLEADMDTTPNISRVPWDGRISPRVKALPSLRDWLSKGVRG